MKDWDDISDSQASTYVENALSITDFVRYQGASGDMNPIHHDVAFAQASGYDQPFAVGMRQAGVLGTRLAEEWGPDAIRRLALRFSSQAWPGEALTYTWQVVGKREVHGERLVDLEVGVARPDGTPHLTGTATVVVT
jgi:acyl dehydratase